MKNIVTQESISKALEWGYNSAVNGVPYVASAQNMAENFLKGTKPLNKKVASLIRWQVTKAGVTGFVTGLGGLLTLPITLPADITVVLFIQIRMVAAIAYMNGYDIHDDRIKTLVYVCLAGHGANEILRNTGIIIGKKFSTEMIKKISGKTLIEINKKVGFRLFTKFGEKGAINLGKLVPIAGGVIGLGFDSITTSVIGNVANKTFVSDCDNPQKRKLN